MNRKDKIFFLLKDPHWTFIWWEITPETLFRIKSEIGEEMARARLIIRVHDVTDIIFNGMNSHYFFDIEVIGDTDHWYLNIWGSNRNYCVESGFKTKDSKFYPMVRSNTLSLPRDCPSESMLEEYSTIII